MFAFWAERFCTTLCLGLKLREEVVVGSGGAVDRADQLVERRAGIRPLVGPERLQILELRLVLLDLSLVRLHLLGVLGDLLGVAHHVRARRDGGLHRVERVGDDVLRPRLLSVGEPARAEEECGGQGMCSAMGFHFGV